MLFEMLAGRRPFIAESLELLLARHLRADTPVLPAAHAAGELKAPSSGVNN
jgi:hypothetical protein